MAIIQRTINKEAKNHKKAKKIFYKNISAMRKRSEYYDPTEIVNDVNCDPICEPEMETLLGQVN